MRWPSSPRNCGISLKTSCNLEIRVSDRRRIGKGRSDVPVRCLSQCRFSCRSLRTRVGIRFSARRVMLVASAFVVFAACLLPSIHGSAIPMWEYLSRGEKMSHLFNLFVQQVEKHCSSRPEPDCSKLLLVYGLTNLAKMEDESLDDMDPYQRGANEIVWDSMMKGSFKHNHVGSYTLRPPTTPSSAAVSSTLNSIDPSAAVEDLDVSDPGSLEAASNINVEEAEPQSFLLGPMVVRVLPNGMPIPGEKNQLPKDEDIEELAPTRFRSFPVNRRPSTNKLGYGDNGAAPQTPGVPYRPSHVPRYHRQHRDDFRVGPPAFPSNP